MPSIVQFEDFREFLREYIAARQRENRRANSLRLVARRFGWQSSYLTDLMKGRKSLTIARALQCARALGMDEFETNHMIFLALRHHKEAAIRSYAEKVLSRSHLQETSRKGNQEPELYTADAAAIYCYLKLKDQLPPLEDIRRALRGLPNLTLRRIEEVVTLLRRLGVIAVDADGRLQVVQGEMDRHHPGASKTEGRRVIGSYSNCALASFQADLRPLVIRMATLILDPKKVEKARARLEAIHQWLVGESEACETAVDRTRFEVYSYALTLVPVTMGRVPGPDLSQATATGVIQ